MIAGTTVQFPGDSGKHDNYRGQDCPGRSFRVTMAGAGAAYTNSVLCLVCQREFDASENALLLSSIQRMPGLIELLKASPLPPVEAFAGAVLEELVKLSNDFNIGSFIVRYDPSLTSRTPASSVVLESFGLLQSHNMVAPALQAGYYFVTTKGREIGTAANFRVYLKSQQANADSMYEVVNRELSAMTQRAESDINQAIADAKKEAQSILNLARKTAEGVSLRDVQTQFGNAARNCSTNVRIWAWLSGLSIASFLGIVICLFTWWAPSFQKAGGETSGFAIYHTALRITFLTAIAAVATFSLKLLRAWLHLREQNLHRQRIANSMDAFLGAASAEQRDIILGRMVDAITAFGNSGLLAEDESMSPAKVVLESVPRALSSK